MKYHRYGKFEPSDYCISWLGMAVLLGFVIASIILDLPVFFVILPTIYIVIWLWTILASNAERFILDGDTIITLLGKKMHTIILPSELTLVVSCADICPPLTQRTAIGNQTHILKDKYAVSIFQKMPLDVTLEALHRNYVRRYTTSMIRTCFEEHRYIYSFVCNQLLLNKLLANRRCLLIIPESLLEEVSFDTNHVDMYIDVGY